MLADYGVPVVPTRRVCQIDAAVAAADALGYPVVLKTAEPAIAHKSDVGGVLLGVVDVEAAYRTLCDRFGPHVLVSATAAPGVEIALGIVRDPQLGPLVVVAAGGVLAELMHDRVVALPPVDSRRARDILDRLKIGVLLGGFRGAPPADVDALVAAICALGVLAVELGDVLAAFDVNPLIVSSQGAVAVDALVVPAAPTLAPPPSWRS